MLAIGHCFSHREGRYKYSPGTTAILTEQVQHFEMDLIEESVKRMETS